MSKPNLTDPIFNDEAAARQHLEAIQWSGGRFCPHCGVTEGTSPVAGKVAGLYFCNACSKKFSVTVGTVMERSHIPLHKWVLAFHLMAASKKGVSAHQLHRMLGITYKSAWFMEHRIRLAMAPAKGRGPLGQNGKIVEMDETFVGPRARNRKNRAKLRPKEAVMALVERNGEARSFHVESLSKETVFNIYPR